MNTFRHLPFLLIISFVKSLKQVPVDMNEGLSRYSVKSAANTQPRLSRQVIYIDHHFVLALVM